MSGPIQKCEELTPPSPPGAYDGRWKWAAVADIGGSLNVLSVTTPSSGDEAQAESSHAITKPSIPHQAERLFTEPNLLIAAADATTAIRGRVIEEMRDEKFCAEREARL
ncbi:MAG: hypothetical protein ACM3NN_12645 [Nitrospirota bacterium]|jgi:hypothetical protein